MRKKNFFKKVLSWLIILLAIFLVGYGCYRIYDAAVENITKRIRREVASEIADTFNPLKWPGKIFGRRSKKNSQNE